MPGFELIGEDERRAVDTVFENGGVLFRHSFAAQRNGVYKVREFEQQIAQMLDVRYAHAVSSGTAAVKVGLKALGIRPGDEVITQSFTFVATVEAILECGATPIVTEVDATLNMDPAGFERRITPRTRAVIPVHTLGVAAKMDEILNIAGRHGIAVLEDTAQALGATYHGKALGTLGNVGTFSFDHGKLVTTGEGGMVVTNDEKTYLHARAYSDHGHEDNPTVPRGQDTRSFPGFNYRMMELQGAIGVVQLRKMAEFLRLQREHKAKLKCRLAPLVERHHLRFREIPDVAGEAGDALVFFLDSVERARTVAERLQALGIGFKNLPDALDWQYAGRWTHIFGDLPGYRGKNLERDVWPVSADLLRRAIALPIMLKMDDDRIEEVAGAVRQALVHTVGEA